MRFFSRQHDRDQDLHFEFGCLERLESRRMLAGTVSVILQGGNVTLNGDRANNDITVQLEADNQLRITGNDNTRIRWNGEFSDSHLISVNQNLTIRLRDGHDKLRLENQTDDGFSGAVSIDLAGGRDELTLDGWQTNRNISVSSGSQDDTIVVRDTATSGNLSIQAQAGNDQVIVSDSQFNVLNVATNNGRDRVQLSGTLSGTRSTVNLGNQSDQLTVGSIEESATITATGNWDLGSSSDVLHVISGNMAQVNVNGGRGNDRIQADSRPTNTGFERFCEADGSNCRTALRLTNNAARNTRIIEEVVHRGGEAIIPAGVWMVHPIAMGSHSSIVGQGQGVSELRLVVDRPTRYEDQHVIVASLPDSNGFIENISVSNITLNGNQARNNWSSVYNDGNAHGLYVRATANSKFHDLEIKNCYTDGIYVSTVLGQTNNSHHNTFERINIHDCGRQGVSVVGGEDLVFDDFTVTNIGKANFGKSPRSAIDLEPEYGVSRLVRNIEITNWVIRNVGQGVLVSGGHSSEQAENITIRNIDIISMDGPQILAVREVENLVVENFTARTHSPVNGGGLGVYLKDTTGKLSDVTINNVRKTNYGIRVLGESDVVFDRLSVSNVSRSFVQIGSDTGQPADNTRVVFNAFTFDRAAIDNTGLPLIRVNSTESVYFVAGTLSGVGTARYVGQLETDTYFYNCTFDRGSLSWFDPSRNGEVLGFGNNWE